MGAKNAAELSRCPSSTAGHAPLDEPWLPAHNARMCYSAQLQAAYLKYLRETGAQMDMDQFVEIFGARITDSSIRIPRAVERWFDEPKTDAERKIKTFIDQYREAEISKLEREAFIQKK